MSLATRSEPTPSWARASKQDLRFAAKALHTAWEHIRAPDGAGERAAVAVTGGRNAAVLLASVVLNRVECPCCGWSGAGFVELAPGAGRTHCPSCGSRSRHRALIKLLGELADLMPPNPSILHFAPEPVVSDAIRATIPGARVQSTDMYRSDVDLPGIDIQAMTLPDDEFDVVVCNHVLEHVTDDRAAVQEIARVVRNGGLAIVTVPGDWDGSSTRQFSHPDPNGHLRQYGNDVVDLLGVSFDSVASRSGASLGDAGSIARWGIRPDEPILLAFA